jgi:hypothetical protein
LSTPRQRAAAPRRRCRMLSCKIRGAPEARIRRVFLQHQALAARRDVVGHASPTRRRGLRAASGGLRSGWPVGPSDRGVVAGAPQGRGRSSGRRRGADSRPRVGEVDRRFSPGTPVRCRDRRPRAHEERTERLHRGVERV